MKTKPQISHLFSNFSLRWALILYGSGLLTLSLFLFGIFFGSLSPVHTGDVVIYERYAELMRHGHMPYSSFPLEYLPGVIPFIALAIPLSSVVGAFLVAYCIETFLVMSAFVSHVVQKDGWKDTSKWAILLIPLSSYVFYELDIFAVVSLYAAVYFFKKRSFDLSACLLAISVLIKTYPGVILLGLIWLMPQKFRARYVLVFGGVLAAVLLPVAIIAPHGLWASITYHSGRPIEIDASAATFGYIAHLLGGSLQMHLTHQSWALAFPGQSILSILTTASLAACLGVVSYAAFRGRLKSSPATLSMVLLAIFILLFKVGSPQYSLAILGIYPLAKEELTTTQAHRLAFRLGAVSVVVAVQALVAYNLVDQNQAILDSRTPWLALLGLLRIFVLIELIRYTIQCLVQKNSRQPKSSAK